MITVNALSSIIILCFEKGIRFVANLWVICSRHIGFGLANARVASGQREPSYKVFSIVLTKL